MSNLKASDFLSDLEITIKTDHLIIDVLWCRVMEKRNDWVIKSHKHPSFEFHFCASGSSCVQFDEGELKIRAGEFYVTPPGVCHQQHSFEEDHYLEYALNCNITLLDQSPNEGMAVYSVLQKSDVGVYPCGDIIPLFENLLSEAENKKIGYYNKIKNIISLILIESTRKMYDSKISYEVPKKIKGYDSRYHEIYAFLKKNLYENLTVLDVAKHLHLSEKQLNRLVKANAKMSVKKLMMRMKLNACKDYLTKTDYQINEIASKLGYVNVYYFNRVFKADEGLTPTQFRKMSKKY